VFYAKKNHKQYYQSGTIVVIVATGWYRDVAFVIETKKKKIEH